MTHKNDKIKLQQFLPVFGIVFLGIFFSFSWFNNANPLSVKEGGKENYSHILQPSPYDDLSLRAKAVFVYKPHTKQVLYEKNSSAQLPLASITKIMTALVAKENLSSISKIVYNNEYWKTDDLLNYTMMVSSNDASSVLASALTSVNKNEITESSFVDKMNKKAIELGLTQTYFLNPAGLDTSETLSGGYGSARDVANLLFYAMRSIPEALEATALKNSIFYSISGNEYSAINTNKAVGEIPSLIAGKTGYTDLAGGNLVIAFDPGMGEPIIAVVLGSTKEERFTDMKKIIRRTLEIYSR